MEFNKSKKTFMSNEATIQDALKRYYKADRLNRPNSYLDERVDRIAQRIARDGWDIIASRHPKVAQDFQFTKA